MALSITQYVAGMLARQRVIARKLGRRDGEDRADIDWMARHVRILNRSHLALLAVVVQTLVEKGVCTDAELAAKLDAIRDDSYDEEPQEVE